MYDKKLTVTLASLLHLTKAKITIIKPKKTKIVNR